MDEQELETKRRTISDLKQFARAEMARELAKRHGKEISLPWDSAPAAAPQSQEIDQEALNQLDGM